MNDYFEKWQIFQAWELAWQMRFCPPLEEVIGQELTPEAAAHLEACLLCQRRRTAEIIEPPGSNWLRSPGTATMKLPMSPRNRGRCGAWIRPWRAGGPSTAIIGHP